MIASIKMRRLTAIAAWAALAASTSFAGAETLTVAPRTVADEKAVFATVESISVVPARGRIGGTIVQLNVKEGDSVTRGQAIAVIADIVRPYVVRTSAGAPVRLRRGVGTAPMGPFRGTAGHSDESEWSAADSATTV